MVARVEMVTVVMKWLSDTTLKPVVTTALSDLDCFLAVFLAVKSIITNTSFFLIASLGTAMKDESPNFRDFLKYFI